MKSPYISRVKIENFRNFKETDVKLNHKQVIIGENNIGKSNFIRAIQLVLDRSFSDIDRELISTDFHDSIEDPIENGEEIKILIEIKNYEHNRQLVAQFDDAVISVDPPTLRFTYKYYPIKDENEQILKYDYKIFKGENELNIFTKDDRNFLNLYVIGALRDVERELNAGKRSPLYKLVKEYAIADEDLERIADSMNDAAEEILELDEIKDIKNVIQNKFQTLIGLQHDYEVSLSPYDLDIERLLYTIQVYMGIKQRPVAELSLGLANILYISMMMLLIKNKTIPRILKAEEFNIYNNLEEGDLISDNFIISDNVANYLIKDDITSDIGEQLYSFFDRHNNKPQPVTLLAVEEPEAHLHPVLQRLIYREILHKSETSVIFTTHSPYITAVAPLETIVYGKYQENETKMFSTVDVDIEEADKKDIERYLDAKRGEIYFGKGVLLVEGITEEYMVPKVCELMNTSLEDLGIIICNVHSTNFKPYVQILEALNIPWSIITDGDCYKIKKIINDDGEEKIKKQYHQLLSDDDEKGFKGIELMKKMLIDLGLSKDEEFNTDNLTEIYSVLAEHGCFVGYYTNEVDCMIEGGTEGDQIFKTVYAELRPGGDKQQENFENEMNAKEYWNALKKIDNNISKGGLHNVLLHI